MRLAGVGAVAAPSLLAASPALTAETLKRLSATEVRARIIGRVITDEAHWSDRLLADGTMQSFDIGHPKSGSWRLDGDELCLIRKERKRTTTECFEVWVSKDQIELRRDGVTVVEGVLRDK